MKERKEKSMFEKASRLVRRLQEGEFQERLRRTDPHENAMNRNRARYISALEEFRRLYGDRTVEIYSAPGRTEIGGNHTDHQRGRVLAASVNLDIIAVVSPTEDNLITLKSAGYAPVCVNLAELQPVTEENGTSAALIRGVVSELEAVGFRAGGFRAYVTGDVPGGAGLSSSAAFEILTGTVISGLYHNMQIPAQTLARAGQEAETRYFGKPCGLMDQMACSVGGLIYIDFANDPPEVRRLETDFERFGHALCIVETGGSHAAMTDEYTAIPAEMHQIAGFYHKEVLAQVDPEVFWRDIPTLRKQFGDRAVLRAIHWFGETCRVSAQADALEAGDFPEFLRLIRASGNSSFQYLQNVSSRRDPREQPIALALAVSDKILAGRGAARVHGGGFAGTIQAFVPEDLVEEYKKSLDGIFGEGACHVLRIRKYGGMKVI